MYHEGYIFHRNKIVAKTVTVYFKCSDKAWGAAGLKRGAGEFKLSKSHNEHEPVALEELKNLFVERPKERAESETLRKVLFLFSFKDCQLATLWNIKRSLQSRAIANCFSHENSATIFTCNNLSKIINLFIYIFNIILKISNFAFNLSTMDKTFLFNSIWVLASKSYHIFLVYALKNIILYIVCHLHLYRII